MTPKQILDTFSEALMQDDQILSAQERTLLLHVLQHAKATDNFNPATYTAVNEVIASAVGETVAQRAFAVLGGSLLERILAPSTGAGLTDLAGTSLGREPHTRKPHPEPSNPQPPGPQPPGAPRPTGPQPPGPPGRPRPADPQPPSGPQPPGGPHGSKVGSVEGVVLEPKRSAAVLENPVTLPARCVVLDEFLAPQEAADLLSHTLSREAAFQSSEVISPVNGGGIVNPDHRRSRVLMDTGEHEGMILERIRAALPSVLASLQMEEFPIRHIESQITASNDGDFFRNHHDNGEPEVMTRRLTFVYFFHNEPRRFEGGELRIHDARLERGRYVSRGCYHAVLPQQNQMVFFPCSLLHEITSVNCPSRLFADSRFTLNGWLHG